MLLIKVVDNLKSTVEVNTKNIETLNKKIIEMQDTVSNCERKHCHFSQFSCEICGKSFKSTANLEKHMKKVSYGRKAEKLRF